MATKEDRIIVTVRGSEKERERLKREAADREMSLARYVRLLLGLEVSNEDRLRHFRAKMKRHRDLRRGELQEENGGN